SFDCDSSSDVCSSDLLAVGREVRAAQLSDRARNRRRGGGAALVPGQLLRRRIRRRPAPGRPARGGGRAGCGALKQSGLLPDGTYALSGSGQLIIPILLPERGLQQLACGGVREAVDEQYLVWQPPLGDMRG